MVARTLLAPLKLPESAHLVDLDDPNNIQVLRRIIQRKPFLQATYQSFYRELLRKSQSSLTDGMFLELGSGASSLKQLAPEVVTSDILPYEGVDRVFSALDMPFADESLRAIGMVDVLHHLQDCRAFFREALRCLKPGGKLVMVEPANTPWSRFIYKNFHHEPFAVRGSWGCEPGGPLSSANMAIPWIIFCRDSELFAQEFPEWQVRSLRIHTPFKYLLSGGLSLRQLLPSACLPLVEALEWVLTPLNSWLGLFMTIELEKQPRV